MLCKIYIYILNLTLPISWLIVLKMSTFCGFVDGRHWVNPSLALALSLALTHTHTHKREWVCLRKHTHTH